MIFKNKAHTFAIRFDNLLNDECGKMIRFLPCIDISWSEFDDNICIGISWLVLSVEFWFGEVEEF